MSRLVVAFAIWFVTCLALGFALVGEGEAASVLLFGAAGLYLVQRWCYEIR